MAATFLPYRPPANQAHNRIATVVAVTAGLIAFLALWAATQRAAAKLAPGQKLTGRVVGTGLANEARDRRPGLRLGVRKMLVSSVRVLWRKKKLLPPFQGYLRITGRHRDKQRHRYQDETPRRSRATKS